MLLSWIRSRQKQANKQTNKYKMDTISYFPQHFNYSASPHLAQTTQSGHFCYKCQVPFVHTQFKPFLLHMHPSHRACDRIGDKCIPSPISTHTRTLTHPQSWWRRSSTVVLTKNARFCRYSLSSRKRLVPVSDPGVGVGDGGKIFIIRHVQAIYMRV